MTVRTLALLSLLAPSPAFAGVFLHYAFDGDFTDSSGQGNDGTLVVDGGATSFTTDVAAFGSAWSHPVEADEDRVAYTTPFDPGPSTPWTVSFWHDMSGGASAPLFDSTSGSHQFLMRDDSTRGVYLRIAGQTAVSWNTAGIVTQGTFNHFVIVADPAGIDGLDADGDGFDDDVALYVDGALITPDPGQSLHTVATNVYSDGYGDGTSGDSTFDNGHGISDELWILLGDALDADQVASLHDANDPCLGDADADGTWDCLDVEACDGVDNDGDGLVDDDDPDVADAATWYEDLDGDGLGDPDASTLACVAPQDTVSTAGDACPLEDATGCDTDVDGCVDDVDGNGTCDASEVFALSSDAPIPGQPMTMTVAWATPGARVWFLGSLAGLATSPPCTTSSDGSTVCLDLAKPKLVGSVRADANGEASVTVTVPAGMAAGTAMYLQAATLAGSGAVTEPIRLTVGP